jgi:uncharacterized protein (TIGR03382 family)
MASTLRCAAALVGMMAAGQALATVSVVSVPGGDAEFNTLTANGTLERAVAEGRIGNNVASSGTWERAIWEFGGVGTPKATGGTTWTSGTPLDFSFSFDGANTVTFILGGETLSWGVVSGPFTDIFIRTRNARSDTSILLSDLAVSGYGLLGSDLSSTTVNEVDYLRIVNTSAFGAVTVTGKATLAWAGSAPTNSALAFQVKFSNVIPGPGAAALAGLGLVAGLRRRR